MVLDSLRSLGNSPRKLTVGLLAVVAGLMLAGPRGNAATAPSPLPVRSELRKT